MGAPKGPRPNCSICGHPIDKRCVHPWNLPFEAWPRHLMAQLRERLARYGLGPEGDA